MISINTYRDCNELDGDLAIIEFYFYLVVRYSFEVTIHHKIVSLKVPKHENYPPTYAHTEIFGLSYKEKL